MTFQLNPAIISILVVISFAAVLTLLLFRPVEIAGEAGHILEVMTGVLGAKFGDVISFHIGSSAGSKAKDALISDLKSKA